MDFWSYMKQSDDYNMMTRLQLRIGIFLLVTVFPISFGDRMGFFMFMMLFFMCEIMIYQLKRKYYSTVQTYVRLNSWDHLGAWDQSGPPSSQTSSRLLFVMHKRSLMYAQTNSRATISSDILAWKMSGEHAMPIGSHR